MISLITVTHNNAQDILPLLNSFPWQETPIEVLLIDNRSSDDTCRRIQSFVSDNPAYPIRLISNYFNIGYAAAINQGLILAQGEFICVLGPDTILHPGALQGLINKLETNPKIGIAAPQLILLDNSIQPSCRRFPKIGDVLLELTGLPRILPQYFKSDWKMDDFDHMTEMIVDQPEATCLFIRRKALEEVGLMDERFPIFFNDVDWCRRFHLKGWPILFVPTARVTHRRGTSVNTRPARMIWKSHQGFYRYFRKYNPSLLQRCLLIIFGFLLIWTACLRILVLYIGFSRASMNRLK